MEDNSVDSVVTDPPYDLESMRKRFGKVGSKAAKHGSDGMFKRASEPFVGVQWDTGEVAHDPAFWREVLRVLKPGGYCLAMSGVTNYHKLATAIDAAGLEVRDMLQWLYATGTPKSHPQGGGRETALKPAQEPICMARKPIEGTIRANLEKWGTGALFLNGRRVPGVGTDPALGGWPSNVLHDGSETIAETMDGKARYFFAAKPTRAERDEGMAGHAVPDDAKGPNFHPTVKPKTLMEWQIGLVTPPGGVVLDPFLGSGSTGKAAISAGFSFIGVEKEALYMPIARARIEFEAQKRQQNQWDGL